MHGSIGALWQIVCGTLERWQILAPSQGMAGDAVKAWSPLKAAGLDLGGRYLGDEELETDVVLAVALLAVYTATVAAFGLRTAKQKAWVVTTFAAATCTAFFVANVALGGLREVPIGVDIMRDTPFSRFLSRYFRLTLVVDLALGVVFYRSQLDFLTSWFHHTAYFLLMNWAISNNVTLLFSVFLAEEFPTFLLGLGSINKALRTDLGFGFSFFVLRILYHAIHFYTIFFMWSRDPEGKMDVIRFNMVLTMSLHLYWFSGWVSQQRRRLGKLRAKEQKAE